MPLAPQPVLEEPVASTVGPLSDPPAEALPETPELPEGRQALLDLIQGLPAGDLGEVAPYKPDGEVQAGLAVPLLKPAAIAGVPCAGTLLLEDAGSAGCKLSANHIFGEIAIRRGAQVGFWMEAGVLQRFTFFDVEPPQERIDFGGVLCMNAATLHASGVVARCVLARERRVDTVLVPKGAEILLDEQGALTGVVLYEPARLDGRDHKPGTVYFEDGSLSDVKVGEF